MLITGKKHLFVPASVLKYAPDKKGVFALFGPSKEVLFYGSTNESIRDLIMNHCKGDINACTRETWYFSYEITNANRKRLKELLNEYKMEYGVVPRCNVKVRKRRMTLNDGKFKLDDASGKNSEMKLK